MTTLVTGDLHFSANPLNAYRDKFVGWLYDRIENRGITDLIILGDLTDAKDEHGAELVNRVVGHLHALSRLCPVYILTGNHDYVNQESPFFAFVRRMDNIHWYNTPTQETTINDIGNCLFLPHTNDWAKKWPPVLKKKYDCILTHCTVQGTTGGFGHKLSGVPVSLFDNQKWVISGDVHYPQEFDKFLYVGAPYTINFGDDYHGRVIEIKGGEWEGIPVKLPQKRLLVVSSIKELILKHELMKGDIVKVEYNLKQREQGRWYDIKAEIKEWGDKRGYVMHSIVPIIDVQTTAYKHVDLRTDDELITAYAKSVGVPTKTLERGINLASRAQQ
jgi:DNA repair exonuclease SbcCD nuclease subunit